MAFNNTAAFSILFWLNGIVNITKPKDFLIQLNIKMHGSNTFFKGVETCSISS